MVNERTEYEDEVVNLIGNPEEARTQAERMSKDQRFVLSRGTL